ncbi:hypothetical protein [Paenimyroides baculatum]|uniref:Uncharacterized protein n=1 Tax=Paenimyroides baculatum TaxID=2608000 RepID=A0A5M6CLM0_9FLAO|nr:hypothetical protein [Paenimyroides baculatum]KAA5535916.1 hypothetical protein F0460_05630 [Paenimyroides baculatum]
MMIPSDKEYIETKKIILGTDKMKPGFIALAKWIDKTFDVKTINIIYDTLYDGNPRLRVCFEFEQEKNIFFARGISNFDKKKQKLIADKFKETIELQDLSKPKNSIFNLFKFKQNKTFQTEDIFVTYSAFAPVAKQEVISKISKEQKENFINSFNNKDIWTISWFFTVPTFFMFTDEKVKEYDNLEFRKIWADKYFEFIKPFDDFDYFKREEILIDLDSKENFDKNYQSNWYYYYK